MDVRASRVGVVAAVDRVPAGADRCTDDDATTDLRAERIIVVELDLEIGEVPLISVVSDDHDAADELCIVAEQHGGAAGAAPGMRDERLLDGSAALASENPLRVANA